MFRFGYSLDIMITEKCNLKCRHCYMTSHEKEMSYKQVEELVKDLPENLNKIVISGGEPFEAYDKMIFFLQKLKEKMDVRNIRISSNGVSLAQMNEEEGKKVLKLLEELSVTEILVSADQFHLKTEKMKQLILKNQKLMKSCNIKMKTIDVGKAVRIGEGKKLSDQYIGKRGCLNRGSDVFSPYYFLDAECNVYLCGWRKKGYLGNIKEGWDKIYNETYQHIDLLSGNICKILFCDNKCSLKKKEEIFKFIKVHGECEACLKYVDE